MALSPSGWYDDPTNQYLYRYWDGTQWTDQVNNGNVTVTDSGFMDDATSSSRPAPDTCAPGGGQATPPMEVAHVDGSGSGIALGVVVAILAFGLFLVLFMSGSDDATLPISTGISIQTTLP